MSISDDNGEFSDDPRVQELQSVQAIYPNDTQINYTALSGAINIPIKNEDGIDLLLHESGAHNGACGSDLKRKHTIYNLPPVKFTFRLPEKYPNEKPLHFQVFSKTIPAGKMLSLLKELQAVWTEYKDEVLFTLIDVIKGKIDYEFDDFIGRTIDCGENNERFESLLTFDKQKQREEFDNQTYSCDICQNDFKGRSCSKFEDCGHIFCNDCLYDYFTSLIQSGLTEKIHCPSFDCTAKFNKLREKYLRLDYISLTTFDFNEFKDRLMTPPISIDLLRSIISSKSGTSEQTEGTVSRYRDLFLKQQYDIISKLFPARLVACSNKNCTEMIFREDVTDPLVICRRCGYAFCHGCRKSWHGAFVKCDKRARSGMYSDIPIEALELWLGSEKESVERKSLGFSYGKGLINKMAQEYQMDKMFNEMLKDENQGLTKCPTCEIIIQRSDGCNKMCCSSCKTYFCNLCGSYLDHNNPYEHYRNTMSECYGRLFEGMLGLAD